MPMQSSWLPKNKRKCEIRIKSKQKKKRERKRSKTEKAPFKSFNIEPLFWMIYYRYYCIISFQKIFLFSKNPRIYLLWNRKVNWRESVLFKTGVTSACFAQQPWRFQTIIVLLRKCLLWISNSNDIY